MGGGSLWIGTTGDNLVFSLKNRIKALTAVFVVLLAAFAALAAILFQENFAAFTGIVRDRSSDQLRALDTVTAIETAFYVHRKSFACAIATGDDKCLVNLKESQQTVIDQLSLLEDFNAARFPDWIASADFKTNEPQKELRVALDTAASHDGDHDASSRQRLYALVRANAESYFKSSDELMRTALEARAGSETTIDATQANAALDLISLGLGAIKARYNQTFWDEAYARNAVFTSDTTNYYRALLIGGALLVALALLIAVLLDRHFRMQEAHEENLVRLGTRDLATGLFNRRSMDSLLAQEVERARRRNYPLSLLMLRVEPYAKFHSELGIVATERLFFQIAEVLRTTCRPYDGLFKADNNTFLVVFPETHPKMVAVLCERFLSRLTKKRFLVRSDQAKVAPTFLVGAASFPLNAAAAPDLLRFAEDSLSERFNAALLDPPAVALAGPAPQKNEPVVAVDVPAPPPPPEIKKPAISPEALVAKLKARAAQTETKPIPPPSPVVMPPLEPEPVREVAPPPNVIAMPDAALQKRRAVADEAHVSAAPPRDTAPSAMPSHEPVVSEDLPDVVTALMQGVAENQPEVERVAPAPLSFDEAVVADDAVPEAPVLSKPPTMQVLHDDEEDVILVDFDREREDIAARFKRKRGNTQNQKS